MSSRAQKQGLAHDPAGAQLPGEACSLGSKQRERVSQSIFCRYVQSQGKLTGMKKHFVGVTWLFSSMVNYRESISNVEVSLCSGGSLCLIMMQCVCVCASVLVF